MSSVYELFISACTKGDLRKAQQLFAEHPRVTDLVTYLTGKEYAFLCACDNGHLEVAQWLLSVKPDINVSIWNECAFTWACARGNLKIAQWLLSVKPDIDISAKIEEAFHSACANGHLEVVQWLFSVKPTIDISAKNGEAFVWAYVRGHLKIVRWLHSLKPDYFQLVLDETQTRIVSYYIIKPLPVSTTTTSPVQLSSFEEANRICPICTETDVAVQTNCGHAYCTPCIQKWWNAGKGDATCPHCRAQITEFVKVV